MWSKGAWHQRPDEAPGGTEGTVETEQRFCSCFLLVILAKYITLQLKFTIAALTTDKVQRCITTQK